MSDYPYLVNGLQTFQPQVQTQPRVWTWLILLLAVAFAVFLTALVKSKGLVKHGFSFAFIAWCGGRRVSLHVRTKMEIAHEDEDEDEDENEEEDEKKGVKIEADLMQKKRGHRRTKSYPALDGLLRNDSSFACLLGTEMFLCIEKSRPFPPSRSNPSLYVSPPQETHGFPLVKREITQYFPDDSVKLQHTPWPLLEHVGKPLIRGRTSDHLHLSGSLLPRLKTFEQQFGFDRTPPWEKPSIPRLAPISSPVLKISVNQQKLLKLFNISTDPITSLVLTPPANQASIGLTDGNIIIWDVEKGMAISRAVSLLNSPISSLLRNEQGNRSIISGKMGIVEQWDERISSQPVSSWALFEPHRDDPITSIISKGGQELICTSNKISYKLDLRMPKLKAIEVFMNIGILLLDEHSVLDLLDSLLFLLPHHDEDEEDCTCETQEQNKPDKSGSFLSRCVKAVRSLTFEYHCA